MANFRGTSPPTAEPKSDPRRCVPQPNTVLANKNWRSLTKLSKSKSEAGHCERLNSPWQAQEKKISQPGAGPRTGSLPIENIHNHTHRQTGVNSLKTRGVIAFFAIRRFSSRRHRFASRYSIRRSMINFATSSESVGEFRLGQSSKVVLRGGFDGFVGPGTGTRSRGNNPVGILAACWPRSSFWCRPQGEGWKEHCWASQQWHPRVEPRWGVFLVPTLRVGTYRLRCYASRGEDAERPCIAFRRGASERGVIARWRSAVQ